MVLQYACHEFRRMVYLALSLFRSPLTDHNDGLLELLIWNCVWKYEMFDYKQGAVGLAIWVPSVANQPKETCASDATLGHGYSPLSPVEDKSESIWRRTEVELPVLENAVDHEAVSEDAVLDALKV